MSEQVKEKTREQLTELLQEWFDWWYNDDEAPVKMPDALHVRTAIALTRAHYNDPRYRAVSERGKDY